jgi:cyclomaltodextrinase
MIKPNVPEWVKDAVFYQIFPDRFAKSQRVFKPANLLDWSDEPHPQKYHGGDLLGVLENLDHIQDLGATAVYMTPIFQSASNHRYHTHDYYQVDPLLGGNKALRELIDEIHRRGMRIVLDGVFNHCSRGFFQFNDVLENGPHSPWIEWFKIKSWPLAPYTGSRPAGYEGWRENRSLPEFDTDHPEAREYIMQIAEFWVREFGIDGWRLDVAGEILTEGFWEEFRTRVRAIDPDSYIVSEIWTLSPEWVEGDKFDAHMNYPFTEAVVNFAGQEHIGEEISEHPEFQPQKDFSAEQFGERLKEILGAYHWETTCVSMNLLDSHDTARMLSIVQGDKASIRLATFFQMTYPGAPSIYYGDEIGIRGTLDYDRQHDDRHARWPMPWDQSQWDVGLLDYFKQTIQLRHNYPALRRGDFRQIYAEAQVFAFTRVITGECPLVVALNVGEKSVSAKLEVDSLIEGEIGRFELVFGEAGIEQTGTELTVELSARSGVVLELANK